VKASNAMTPRSFFEQCETLRARPAGRKSLGAIVGGLDSRTQESQHISPIMLLAGFVEEPLIVRIAEAAVSEVGRQFAFQFFHPIPISFSPHFLSVDE
jgi:hypothetical protein